MDLNRLINNANIYKKDAINNKTLSRTKASSQSIKMYIKKNICKIDKYFAKFLIVSLIKKFKCS